MFWTLWSRPPGSSLMNSHFWAIVPISWTLSVPYVLATNPFQVPISLFPSCRMRKEGGGRLPSEHLVRDHGADRGKASTLASFGHSIRMSSPLCSMRPLVYGLLAHLSYFRPRSIGRNPYWLPSLEPPVQSGDRARSPAAHPRPIQPLLLEDFGMKTWVTIYPECVPQCHE